MAATTELFAINAMLATIGEAPINSLSDVELVDVSLARTTLTEVVRSVLIDGWAWNTDEAFPLYPEGFSPYAIYVPPNALSVLPNASFSHITVRGSRLYNTADMTFDFHGSEAVTCQIIWDVPFDELPEVTRQYVSVRANRLFQKRSPASETLDGFTQGDEMRAFLAHNRANTRTRRKNFLADSAAVRNIHMTR